MLIDLVKIREFVKGEFAQVDTDSFILDDDIDRWANEAYYKYVDRMILAEQGWFETDYLLDITANEEEVALPFNFNANQLSHHRSVRLEKVLSGGTIPLSYRRRRSGEYNPTNSGGTGESYLPTYDFRGMNLILEPTPIASETDTLKLIYGAMPARLESETAVAGGSSTITLASTADPRDDYYNGARIYIASGVGVGQIRTISDYVGSTKVATVSVAWGTQPTSASVYSILPHSDFPEMFLDLLWLFASKKAFLKERSRGIAASYDGQVLKERELEFNNFINERTAERKFVQPWNVEL